MENEISSIKDITINQAKESEKIAEALAQVSNLSNDIASQTQNVYAACEGQTSSAEQMKSSCEILTKSSKDALDQVIEFSKGIVMRLIDDDQSYIIQMQFFIVDSVFQSHNHCYKTRIIILVWKFFYFTINNFVFYIKTLQHF